MERTFGFIDSGRPHVTAAAFAFGREDVIPGMFKALLERMGIGPEQAPVFHFYLERHIHLDGDAHGPLSARLLQAVCGDDPRHLAEAEAAAVDAIRARLDFWDGVAAAIAVGSRLDAAAG